ncbi:MAG: AMP-binding protein, partial [Burkholderiaceae bacterium]
MPLPEPQILRYTRWLERERGLKFDATTTTGYDEMWRWSVADLRAFWGSIWDYFDVRSPTPYSRVLVDEVMPGAQWFPGARLNYAAQVLRHAQAAHAAGHRAIIFQSERLRERGEMQTLEWPELRRQVGALAAAFKHMGVAPGERVCAYLPNVPQTVVAFLACASVGAVWSVCSPDMGPVAVLDRFAQIEP